MTEQRPQIYDRSEHVDTLHRLALGVGVRKGWRGGAEGVSWRGAGWRCEEFHVPDSKTRTGRVVSGAQALAYWGRLPVRGKHPEPTAQINGREGEQGRGAARVDSLSPHFSMGDELPQRFATLVCS